MDTEKRPIRTTLLFGLVCGLLFIPINLVFQYTIFWPTVFRLTIFFYLAVYSVILAKWGNKSRLKVFFSPCFSCLFLFSIKALFQLSFSFPWACSAGSEAAYVFRTPWAGQWG